MTVPSGATSGPVGVTTAGGSSTSAASFTVDSSGGAAAPSAAMAHGALERRRHQRRARRPQGVRGVRAGGLTRAAGIDLQAVGGRVDGLRWSTDLLAAGPVAD